MDSSDVTFKLYSTNGSDVFVFDNSKMPVVNLTLTATNGDVDKTTTLDKSVKYVATEHGKGSVTAKIENAAYTIYFDNILRDVDLSVSAENITYLENEVLTLTYNNTATGKVNITLKSKNYNKTGKVVSNANMIIDLNGVKTTYKSNDQGKITLPTADFAPGTYVGTVTYPGNARYNSISAVFKVDV